MKLFPILAIVAVGCFAIIGYGAGTFVGSAERTLQEPSEALAHDVATTHGTDALSATNLSADAILRTAEANQPAALPDSMQKAVSLNDTRHVASDGVAKDTATAPHFVRMSNVTLPIRKRESVTYVVADFAVAITDAGRAAHYEVPQNAAQLQAAIEAAMARAAADTSAFQGVAIDSGMLSSSIRTELQQSFADVEDVLFLTLYKHDLGYN